MGGANYQIRDDQHDAQGPSEAKTKQRMKASDKFYNKITITVEGTRKSPCSQKMYLVPKIRGKFCIGGLNGLSQNHRERGKKGMSTQLCQLIEGYSSSVLVMIKSKEEWPRRPVLF